MNAVKREILAILVMVGLYTGGAILLPDGAWPAEQAAPSAMTEYTFTFTVQETNVIETALNELPKRIADPIIGKMVQQAQQQRDATAAPKDANGTVAGPPDQTRKKK